MESIIVASEKDTLLVLKYTPYIKENISPDIKIITKKCAGGVK